MSKNNGEYRFLDCRDIGHQWVSTTSPILNDKGKMVGYERVLRCNRWKNCVVRTDSYDLKGFLVSRSYGYPLGYKIPGGVDRRSLRLENLKRSTKEK